MSHKHGPPVTAPGRDHLLTPDEVATRLGVSPRWVYRHAEEWPFTKRLSRKVLRFSEAGLQRWLEEEKA